MPGLGGPEHPPLATIVGTEVHTLTSTVRGRVCRISATRPLGYGETDAEYPVTYMLDADFLFGIQADLAPMLAFGAEAQEVILVGVGYGGASVEEWGWLRSVDLTPSVDAGSEEMTRELNPYDPGGKGGPRGAGRIGDHAGRGPRARLPSRKSP